MKKIIIDIHGADSGITPIVEGAADALKRFDGLNIVTVGDTAAKAIFSDVGADMSRIEFIDADDFITNEDSATCVFGGRDGSSMVKALLRLKEDDNCFALLSAGSTGPLLVGSLCRLGLIKGIKRPALSCALPTANGKLVCLADCGANLECLPKELLHYALMGDAFMKCMCGLESPRIGLLSVGRERGKGTANITEAYELLGAAPVNFIGNVEGCDLNSDVADVIVSEGFAGNILLKCAESSGLCAAEIARNIADKNGQFDTATEIKKSLEDVFDFNRKGGATFLGTAKTVIKMHGCATRETVVACCAQAIRLENANFSEKIAQALKKQEP